MNVSDAVSDFVRWIKGPQPYQPPPVRFAAGTAPIPVPVPPSNAPLIQQPQPSAALVSSIDHGRGRGHTGSLISGR